MNVSRKLRTGGGLASDPGDPGQDRLVERGSFDLGPEEWSGLSVPWFWSALQL